MSGIGRTKPEMKFKLNVEMNRLKTHLAFMTRPIAMTSGIPQENVAFPRTRYKFSLASWPELDSFYAADMSPQRGLERRMR